MFWLLQFVFAFPIAIVMQLRLNSLHGIPLQVHLGGTKYFKNK